MAALNPNQSAPLPEGEAVLASECGVTFRAVVLGLAIVVVTNLWVT